MSLPGGERRPGYHRLWKLPVIGGGLMALVLIAPYLLPLSTALAQTYKVEVEFVDVTINEEKRAKFTKDINTILNEVPAKIDGLGSPELDRAVVTNPAAINKQNPDVDSTTVGLYDGVKRTLYISSEAYGNSDDVRTVIAHEILHSFAPAHLGYEDSHLKRGDVYEEMLVDYYSNLHFGSPRTSSGYPWLTALVPQIEKVLSLAGVVDPPTALKQALWKHGFASLDKEVAAKIGSDSFFNHLSNYLDTKRGKSNTKAARQYMTQVEEKLAAANKKLIAVVAHNAATGGEENSSFIISSLGGSVSKVYLSLSAAPKEPVKLEVSTQGALPLYLSGTNSLTFDKTDYNNRKELVVTYPGGATPGSIGRVVLKANGAVTKYVGFSLADDESVADDDTTGTVLVDSAKSAEVTTKSNGFKIGLPFSSKDKYASFNEYFTDLVNFAVLIASLLAVLMILYGSYIYVQSQGDPAQINTAREYIVGAIIGLALLLLIRLVVPTLGIEIN